MMRIVVFGAGGFAREVRWLIEEINERQPQYEFAGHVVSDLSRLGEHDSISKVEGDVDWLESNRASVDAVAIGIGNPAARLRIADEVRARCPWLCWPALIHPTVRMDRGSCVVEEGVLLCAGVIATVNVRFQSFSMVNLSCTVGHEAVIGAGSVLNPTINVSGGVRIGRGVLVGVGAQILQFIQIGDGATIGAGAVVTRDVAAGTTVVGMPAKPLLK